MNNNEHESRGKAMKALYHLLPENRIIDYWIAFFTFLKVHRRLPNLKNGSINDALFHIRSSDEILDPLRVFVSDKAFLKDYVRAKVGESHNVPTISVLESLEDALHFDYPADCVIKPTHMSGEVILRHGGEDIDFGKIRSWLRENYYRQSRQANYRQLRAKVIVEPFIFGLDAVEDYKIFCLHGRPLAIQLDFDRHTRHTRSIFTTEWEHLPLAMSCPIGRPVPKPDTLDEMLRVAAVLSRDFNFVRIDLYTNGKEVLVGEITNCHLAGHCIFEPAAGEWMFSRLLFGEKGFSPAVLARTGT